MIRGIRAARLGTTGRTPWPSQIYERLLLLCWSWMPKKFEGHGSGEVEVKTGKMLQACELLPHLKNLEDIFGSLYNYSDQECGHLLPGFPLNMAKENIYVFSSN